MVLFKLIIEKTNTFNIVLLLNLVINHIIIICLKLFIIIMVGSLTHITNNKNQQFVQWTVNDKKHIQNIIIPILQKYPPLTSRSYFQLKFLIHCINHSNVQEYLQTKNKKFELQNNSFLLFLIIIYPLILKNG
uniref:LAGLIDADG homing endonuclease n=1 Tax=Malassezia brasiliensis TaxID=1821822 RepID=UPI0030027500|nr:LAGLIDADG homing endonuclease [Malassezia brasiliensis]